MDDTNLLLMAQYTTNAYLQRMAGPAPRLYTSIVRSANRPIRPGMDRLKELKILGDRRYVEETKNQGLHESMLRHDRRIEIGIAIGAVVTAGLVVGLPILILNSAGIDWREFWEGLVFAFRG